jgi:superfamily II DNA/RNA helicase
MEQEESVDTEEESGAEIPSLLNYSTKIRFLLTQLRVLCTETEDKAIVFCNYQGTARKIESVLESDGIQCTNLVGNIFSKNKKLKKFRCEEDCRIMFLHSNLLYSGMDFFNANHIFFVNSDLNCHVVQQAVGRCVRLSQSKDVNVTFLSMHEIESTPDMGYVLGPFYNQSRGDQNNGVPGVVADANPEGSVQGRQVPAMG